MTMNRKRSQAIVVMDTHTNDVEQIYVGYSMRESVNFFLKDLAKNIDPKYSDSKDVLKNALRRYTFSTITASRVSVRRT